MTSQRIIAANELIINEDGSAFHLHIKPCQLQPNIILVGDPNRVAMISSLLDFVYSEGSNREFVWCSGEYKGKKITILSTGIGSDNIDIVLNELDSLVNIDYSSRAVKSELTELNIVRLGTCGVLQDDISAGEVVISRYSIGIDSLLGFYSVDYRVLECELAEKFREELHWSKNLSKPYAAKSCDALFDKFKDLGRAGITVTAPGFYAPQGRYLRIKPWRENFIADMAKFSYDSLKVNNLEMEAAPIMAMSSAMGHSAITLCIGIAQRANDNSNFDYHAAMLSLAKGVLDRF
ncbi:MAG: nucleoside phosphorylase [Rikenellaceae bacterium]